MMLRAVFSVALLIAGPALAQDAAEAVELKPAPDYFVETVVATTTAQQLALSCAALSLNPPVVQQATSEVLSRLEADGFDVGRTDGGMDDPSDRFTALQQAFLQKHGLREGIDEASVCRAGMAEINEGSEIGSYLLVVQ